MRCFMCVDSFVCGDVDIQHNAATLVWSRVGSADSGSIPLVGST
jgi:hypothetical protein